MHFFDRHLCEAIDEMLLKDDESHLVLIGLLAQDFIFYERQRSYFTIYLGSVVQNSSWM